jgi:transposase
LFLPNALKISRRDFVTEAAIATSTTTPEQWRGSVLGVLRKLVNGHEHDQKIVAIFEKLVARNSELELMLMARRHKGEGVSAAQLMLFLESLKQPQSEAGAAEAIEACSAALQAANDMLRDISGIDRCSAAEEKSKAPPQPRVRAPFPESLERIEDVIRVPDNERPCPKCGNERACFDHDVVEVADIKPAEVFVRVEKREKLTCKECEGAPVRAPVGDRVVSGGRFGSKLVAQMVVDKYDDGLPLHRQKQRIARMGLPVSVSTLADQIKWATELLEPLWRAAQEEVLRARVLHVDGTGLPVLVRDPVTHKKIGTGKKLGTLWGYVGGQTALYLYCSSGHKEGQEKKDIGPEDFLKRRKGYTVADAALVFEQSFKRDDLIECGCNMHARRYFFKALDGKDERAALPIAGFKKLYDIEEKARDLDDEARLDARRRESQPVYDVLLKWCRTYEPEEPPNSPLGKAVRYTLNNCEALMRFLDDGCIPIDNGPVERLHVRAALTRKNFLFAGSDEGGRRAAIAYTLLGSCRLATVNPFEYLADVLPKLIQGVAAADLAGLLPAAWRDRHAQPIES